MQLAQRLRETVAGRGELVRWGGEEFLVLIQDPASVDDLAGFAESLRHAVEQQSFTLPDGQPLARTLSLGAGPFPMRDADGEPLGWQQSLERVDQALYESKAAGRNRVSFARA